MSTIPSIKIDIRITEFSRAEGNILEDLIVGDEDIDKHIDEVSARITQWSTLVAESERQASLKKLEYDVWLAQMKQEVCKSKDFKSETAKQDAVMMANIEEYALKNKDLIDAEYNISAIKSFLDGFKAKKEMLVSLSANKRSEMERDMLVKEWNKKVSPAKG